MAAPPMSDVGAPDLYWNLLAAQTEFWENVPELMWPESMITYARMRHDLQITAILQAYKLPILRATWALDPAGCKPEVVQRVSDNLGLMVLGDEKPPGPARRRGIIWQRHLEQALGELTFGNYAFERRYAELPDGFMGLDALSPRPPWTISNIAVKRSGEIDHILQAGINEPLNANRLVWYVTQQEGANWAGISMLRACYGAWLLKHEGWRVNATSIRRFGMGVPWVEAPAGATNQQLTVARQLASSMTSGAQAGAGLPQGFVPHLMGIQGNVPDGLGWIRYLDQAMAESALVQLLKLGQTTTGSRALGESFLDLFLLALQAIADEIALTATSGHPGMPGVVTDLVDQNWTNEPAPRIVCTDVGENHAVTAEAVGVLLNSGALQSDPALEAWVRKTWRLPARTVPYQQATAPPGTPPPPGGQQPAAGRGHVHAGGPVTRRQASLIEATKFDPALHQGDWEAQLAVLLLSYQDQVSAQRADLVDRVVTAMKAGKLGDLALAAPASGDGALVVAQAMEALAATAAQAMIAEAAAQGIVIDPAEVAVDAKALAGVASARAGVAATRLAESASVKALQLAVASGDLAGVAAAAGPEVDAYLASLSTAGLREQLGAALTAAQNAGRVAVLKAGAPDGTPVQYVAMEVNDVNTCGPCAAEDGHEFASLEDAEAAYPTGGYVNCQGLARCRGTVAAIWGDGNG